MSLPGREEQFVSEIRFILEQARQRSYQAINTAMIEAYWQIGKKIVEEEQNGQDKAEYGKKIIDLLAKDLTKSIGKSYSARNLRYFRQFYLYFPTYGKPDDSIWNALRSKLNWTHIRNIMRVPDESARLYYIKETVRNNWTSRTLDRNIATHYYQRLLLSQQKDPVKAEMEEINSKANEDKSSFIKNPYVLEFLNLPTNTAYTEARLEQLLLDNIQKFLLELGKGFSFVGRQKLVRTEHSDFYIDLVFYNYILKCFVIIELKTERMTHQDVGQLDMYVRMFDEVEKQESDNPTIGILLCSETDKTVAHYSVLKENKHLFATKYFAYLPSEEELIAEIEREKEFLSNHNEII